MIRKPKTVAQWAALVVGGAALLVECAFVPAEANAIETAINGGPPTTSTPGPFYNQGDFIGICVADPGSGAADYVERNTNFGTRADPNPAALGNCAPNHVQAVFPVDPSLFPLPAPSATPSSTSSSGV